MENIIVGAEVAVAYLLTWLVAKARRGLRQADEHVDAAVDAGVDYISQRLHELIGTKLRGDFALEQLELEAGNETESPTERTVQRVTLALEEAVEGDPSFARAIEDLVGQLQSASGTGEPMKIGDRTVTVTGSVEIRASDQSVAAMIIGGGVNLGNPRSAGPFLG